MVEIECPVGADGPLNCSAGHCRRCSDFRDGWNANLRNRKMWKYSNNLAARMRGKRAAPPAPSADIEKLQSAAIMRDGKGRPGLNRTR
jgi:hypothetical protein